MLVVSEFKQRVLYATLGYLADLYSVLAVIPYEERPKMLGLVLEIIAGQLVSGSYGLAVFPSQRTHDG